jgi:hypothetical protein
LWLIFIVFSLNVSCKHDKTYLRLFSSRLYSYLRDVQSGKRAAEQFFYLNVKLSSTLCVLIQKQGSGNEVSSNLSSHRSKYLDYCFLECDTVRFCKYLPIFRWNILFSSSGLNPGISYIVDLLRLWFKPED